MTLTDVARILAVFDRHDSRDDLFWRVDGEVIHFSVNCNDLFVWGCADGEDLTADNVGELERAYADATAAAGAVTGKVYGAMLFCCRMRGMRPQGCCYPDDRRLWPLIDACGPERAIGLGNPYPPGGRPKE